MYNIKVFIAVQLDPLLSAAMVADKIAGATTADLEYVYHDIQHVMRAAALRGDAFAEEHFGDILRKF